MSVRCKEVLLVAVVAFLGLAAVLVRTDRMTDSDPDYAMPWDQHKYMFMASHNPFDFHIAPFGWRVLNPLLAKTLPFNVATSFAILSFVGLWLTAIVMYFVLRRMGLSSNLAFTGLLFFLTLGWATRVNLYDFWLTDPLAFLFCVAAFWSILAGKHILFAILLAIGVTAKESVVFVAPLYYTFNARTLVDAKMLRRAFLLAAPAILILVLLRVAITPMNGNAEYLATIPENLRDANPYSIAWLFGNIGWPRIQESLAGNLAPYSIGTFGVSMVFLPLFAIRKNLDLLLRFLPFILLTYSSVLFATNTTRLIVLAFLAVIPMTLYGIRSIVESTGSDERLFIALPLVMFVIQLIRNDGYIVPPLLESLVALAYLAFILQSKAWGIPKLLGGK